MKRTEKRWGFVYKGSDTITSIQLANPGATREEAEDVKDSNERLVRVTIQRVK